MELESDRHVDEYFPTKKLKFATSVGLSFEDWGIVATADELLMVN